MDMGDNNNNDDDNNNNEQAPEMLQLVEDTRKDGPGASNTAGRIGAGDSSSENDWRVSFPSFSIANNSTPKRRSILSLIPHSRFSLATTHNHSTGYPHPRLDQDPGPT